LEKEIVQFLNESSSKRGQQTNWQHPGITFRVRRLSIFITTD
jgi:hypothetical protein